MNNNNQPLEKLITPEEASEILCISPLTLRKWRWEGKKPQFVKIGRKVAYRRTDIASFIEAQIRKSTSDHSIHNVS